MENKCPLFHVFQKQLATRRKTEEYLSYVNIEHASFSQNGFVICPLFRMMAKFSCLTISTSSHHVYIVMDTNEHVML